MCHGAVNNFTFVYELLPFYRNPFVVQSAEWPSWDPVPKAPALHASGSVVTRHAKFPPLPSSGVLANFLLTRDPGAGKAGDCKDGGVFAKEKGRKCIFGLTRI